MDADHYDDRGFIRKPGSGADDPDRIGYVGKLDEWSVWCVQHLLPIGAQAAFIPGFGTFSTRSPIGRNNL